MIRVRLNEKENRIAITVKCKINDKLEKEINLNRLYDEALESTLERLYSTFTKHNSGGKNKKLKKDTDPTIDSTREDIPLYLFDQENQLVPNDTKNIDAWKENYTFRIKDQEFKVVVNLPSVKKLNLTKILIAGMPAFVKCEFEGDECTQEILQQKSLFKWYISENVYEPADLIELESDKKPKKVSINMDLIKWNLIEQGVSKQMINLNDDCENRLVKVECFPKDDIREGVASETVALSPVLKKIEKEKLPMTERHRHTQNFLDNKKIRVLTWNILSKSNCDRKVYSFASKIYLDFNYRKILIIKELMGYNSDIIFLQECEKHFYNDLKICFPKYNIFFKQKSQNINDGVIVMFRSDRFSLINSFDIVICDEYDKNSQFGNLKSILQKYPFFHDNVKKKGSVAQILKIQSISNKNIQFFLVNTHLSFDRDASFTTLIQSVVILKYLENILGNSKEPEPNILLAADLNAPQYSSPFDFITRGVVNFSLLNENQQNCLKNYTTYIKHSFELSAFTDYEFSYINGVVDYLFYNSSCMNQTKFIPLPSRDKLREFYSVPCKSFPSDHFPLIFEFNINRNKNR